jgi:hypothetical protein
LLLIAPPWLEREPAEEVVLVGANRPVGLKDYLVCPASRMSQPILDNRYGGLVAEAHERVGEEQLEMLQTKVGQGAIVLNTRDKDLAIDLAQEKPVVHQPDGLVRVENAPCEPRPCCC